MIKCGLVWIVLFGVFPSWVFKNYKILQLHVSFRILAREYFFGLCNFGKNELDCTEVSAIDQ